MMGKRRAPHAGLFFTVFGRSFILSDVPIFYSFFFFDLFINFALEIPNLGLR